MREKKVRELIQDEEVNVLKKISRGIYAKIIYYICGAVMSLIFIFPLIYMFAASTKSAQTIADQSGTFMMFVPDFSRGVNFFENYQILFGQRNIGKYALNSFAYAGITIVLNILVNGFAAYAISKLRFPGKKFFNAIIIFLIVVPVESSIIPMLTIAQSMLGLVKELSIWAAILPGTISIFNIFLFIQFFSSIPKEFEEAARMDGCNTLQIFFKVILPLSKPIIATVSVFCFIGVWNDYLWPIMVLYKSDYYPIQAALETIRTADGVTTGQIMASLVVTSIPIFIVYIAAQKYIVKSFGAGGLKI